MERRLTAILAADVAGYSRLMGNDEAGTLAALQTHRRELIDGKIAEHRGRIVKLMGDGMLAEFPSVVNAVACAADIQRGMRERNDGVPESKRIEFRIGIHLGDVIVEENDIYGDGVNVAARIEGVAKPGGIAVSAVVRDNVGNRLDIAFEDAGEHRLKNIDRPVRVYDIALSARQAPSDASRMSTETGKPSIAVLPFNNMSGDPEQEYFSDGITEDIITDLSKISGLRVIARNSVFTYKGKPIDIEEVCRRFKVSAVLEGSVRKAGQRVRITAQLVSGKDPGHLWAERYDRDLTDIFAIQDDIAHAIVAQLRVRLLPEEKKALEAAPTDNAEAYNHYLKGRQFALSWNKSQLLSARWMFAKAVELDPNYARAWAAIAACNSILHLYHVSGASLDGILEMTAKALALDPKLAEPYAARGLALLHFGRSDEAVESFEQALAIDPSLYEANFFYARYFYARGNYKKVAELLERAAQIRQDDYRSPTLLTAAYRSLGRDEDRLRCARLAVERAERELAEHPDNSTPAQFGSIALANLGERGKAREWAHRAIAIDPDDPETQYVVAGAYAQMGDLDEAMDLLEKAHNLPNLIELLSWTKNDPDLEPLRNYPRYRAMMASIDKR